MRYRLACMGWAVMLVVAAGCASVSPTRVPGVGKDVLTLAQEASVRYGVPVSLILGVIEIESSFRPNAVSRVGARGLMQLMPRTAAELAKALDWQAYDIFDPAFNIHAGTAYLAQLIDQFRGDLSWALVAYNGGPARALSWQRRRGTVPADSGRYARNVLAAQARYRGHEGPVTVAAVGPTADERAALSALVRQQLSDGS